MPVTFPIPENIEILITDRPGGLLHPDRKEYEFASPLYTAVNFMQHHHLRSLRFVMEGGIKVLLRQKT
jgi:hypothetical protein